MNILECLEGGELEGNRWIVLELMLVLEKVLSRLTQVVEVLESSLLRRKR